MTTTDLLSNVLENLKKEVIGLFKPNFSDNWMAVVENDGGLIKIVFVKNMFGLDVEHTSIERGVYQPFPDGKTLAEMVEDPISFDDWYKSAILNMESAPL